MDEIRELQQWYLAQCDGDWEHGSGVQIGTLDNPGWRVRINLVRTSLESASFNEVANLAPERDWLRCWVQDGTFHGAGGPLMLGAILQHFLDWVRASTSDPV